MKICNYVILFCVLTSSVSAQWSQNSSLNTYLQSQTAQLLGIGTSGGNLIASVGYRGLRYSTDNGSTWTPVTGLGSGVFDNFINFTTIGADLYAIGGANGVEGTLLYRSANNGVSWDSAFVKPPVRKISGVIAYPMINYFSSGSTRYIGTNGDGIYRSTNNGASWKEMNSGITAPVGGRVVVNMVFVGDTAFVAIVNNSLYKAALTDTVWKPVTVGMSFINNVIKNGDDLYAFSASGGEYRRSTNGGISWTFTGNLPAVGTTVKLVQVGSSWLYGGTDTLKYTLNYSSWQNAVDGLTPPVGFKNAVTHGTNIFGIFSAKLWQRPVSQLTSIKAFGQTQPTVFSLSQNYPNPFNPSTHIEFSTPLSGYTTLKVFNTLGEEIATLFDGIAETAQSYRVHFNAPQYASGLLFARLQQGDKIQVRKMILLK